VGGDSSFGVAGGDRSIAVRGALGRLDRAAYQDRPERVDGFWTEAETWAKE
jgi:hypothetical protein